MMSIQSQIFCEYPQSVAALFRFAAVGIKDPHCWAIVTFKRAIQYTVRSNPEVPIADQPDYLRRQLDILNIRIYDKIIVPQTVIFFEIHFHIAHA